jgi:hypothetical protein
MPEFREDDFKNWLRISILEKKNVFQVICEEGAFLDPDWCFRAWGAFKGWAESL